MKEHDNSFGGIDQQMPSLKLFASADVTASRRLDSACGKFFEVAIIAVSSAN